MKAGTPREDPKNPYTTQDKKILLITIRISKTVDKAAQEGLHALFFCL